MSDNNQTVDYYIAPKESFDATADAIRAVTGENGEIEWKSNGFADALEIIPYKILERNLLANKDIYFETFSTIVTPYAFAYYPIKSVTISDSDKGTEIWDGRGNYCFFQSDLESFSASGLVKLNGEHFFENCTKLTSVSLPNAVEIHANTFQGDTNLELIALPSLDVLFTQTFYGCSKLHTIDLGQMTRGMIRNSIFSGCSKLTTLIIRKSDSPCVLSYATAFSNTPYANGGSGGEIYVPSLLIEDYKNATNWSVLNGYGTITWKPIEGSIYETQYADGTPVGGAS